MYIEGNYRQPTFLYESIWNLLDFAMILILRRKCSKSLERRSHITAFYLIWYGFSVVWSSGMRTDSLMFFGLRVSQWLISCPYRSQYNDRYWSKSKESPALYYRGGKLNNRSCIYSCCLSFVIVALVYQIIYCTKAWSVSSMKQKKRLKPWLQMWMWPCITPNELLAKVSNT